MTKQPTAQGAWPKARIAITVMTAAGVVVSAWLGQWQLGRAAHKVALAQQIQEQNTLEPLIFTAQDAIKNKAISPNRSVVLQGQWLPQYTVYLQNRQMNRLQGFYVLTPLRLENVPADSSAAFATANNAAASLTAPVVLVQRGWVARDFQDLARLPAINHPSGRVQVQGRVLAQPSSVYALGQESAGESRIRHNLDMSLFAAQTQLPLLPFALLQTDTDSDGLLRQWSAPDAGVDKHYGYAFQWFALCALIVVLYVWYQFIAPRRRRAN